jgi:hypothetical protein
MQPVSITYKLTAQDFVDAYQLRRAQNPVQRWTSRLLYVLLTVIVAGGVVLLVAESTRETMTKVLPIFLFAALWFWFVRWLPARFARRQFQSQSAAQSEQTVEFSDSGIRTTTEGAPGAMVPWSAIAQFQEGPRVLLLHLERGLFVVYPKRAFDPAGLGAIREAVAGKVISDQ